MRSIQDINFKSKKALIRVDFNVPLDAGFNVADDTRIRAAKPTIIKVLEDGGSCILMSHLGRPTFNDPQFSLRHIVNKLQDILGVSVLFSTDCVGEKADQLAKELEPGQVLLLENLRYHKAETSGDLKFAEKLSRPVSYTHLRAHET